MGILSDLFVISAFFGMIDSISQFNDKRKQKKEIRRLEREEAEKMRRFYNYLNLHYTKSYDNTYWIRRPWHSDSDGPQYLDENFQPIYFENNYEEEYEESSASIRNRFKKYCNNNEIEFEFDPENYTIPSEDEMLRIMKEDRYGGRCDF